MTATRLVIIGPNVPSPALAAAFPSADTPLHLGAEVDTSTFVALREHGPDTVVLDLATADSRAGADLIRRIYDDRGLDATTISVIVPGQDGGPGRLGHLALPSSSVTHDPVPPAAYREQRRVLRQRMSLGTIAMVDGDPVSVINCSAHGLQIVTSQLARPRQRLRLSLPGQDGGSDLRSSATTIWVQYELSERHPKGYYRVGLELETATNHDIVEHFAATHAAAALTNTTPTDPASD